MTQQTSGFFAAGGMPLLDAAQSYAIDSWQRSVLYADVMRRRGNQYQAHLAEKVPNVLDFEADIVLSGLALARPVNYGLARIAPAPGVDTPEDLARVRGLFAAA